MIENSFENEEAFAALKAEILELIRQLFKMQGNSPSEWLRNKEVMQLLDISQSGLQNLRVNGLLPYSKLKGTLYYRRSDIEDLLMKNYKRIR